MSKYSNEIITAAEATNMRIQGNIAAINKRIINKCRLGEHECVFMVSEIDLAEFKKRVLAAGYAVHVAIPASDIHMRQVTIMWRKEPVI